MRQPMIICLGLITCVAYLGGCGKSEDTAASSKTTTKPPAEEVTAPIATSPESHAAAITAATNTAKNLPAEKLAKAAESPPATAQVEVPPIDVPKFQRTDNTPSSTTTGSAGQANPMLAALSQDQVVRALEEALGKGLQQAISRLGHDGGFLTNLSVRIPMPEKLQKVERALRAMKQDKLADDFVATMNHAAEQAVPEAAEVFADALKHMTIEDAKSILAGPNDAATQYFRKASQTNLYTRFYPIVQKATEKTKVTAAYKNMVEKINLGGISDRLGGLGSALGGSLLGKDALDLDAYVTTKAMDGLFKMVAEEEKQIRQSPVARTSDLLQKVFGVLKK